MKKKAYSLIFINKRVFAHTISAKTIVGMKNRRNFAPSKEQKDNKKHFPLIGNAAKAKGQRNPKKTAHRITN